MATANSLKVTRNGFTVNIAAVVEGQDVSLSINLFTLIKDLGRIPSVEEFWTQHVAPLFANKYVEAFAAAITTNVPDSLEIPSPESAPETPAANAVTDVSTPSDATVSASDLSSDTAAPVDPTTNQGQVTVGSNMPTDESQTSPPADNPNVPTTPTVPS